METQITDLFGLQIYTEKGMFIGEVEDVLIDVDQKKIESIIVGKGQRPALRAQELQRSQDPVPHHQRYRRYRPDPPPAGRFCRRQHCGRRVRDSRIEQREIPPIIFHSRSRMVCIWKTVRSSQISPPFPPFLYGLTGGRSTASLTALVSRSRLTSFSTRGW